jgi:proteasome lid subunit RPN8/RPN11
MKESEDLTYVAVITISLPGAKSETNFTLTLMPSDSVRTSDGILKPLQDCTLGELSQFADALEAELLSRYSDSTLVDLAIDGEAEVAIHYEDDRLDSRPPADLWLEQIVVLTDVDVVDEDDEVDLVDDQTDRTAETASSISDDVEESDSADVQFDAQNEFEDLETEGETGEAIETTDENQFIASVSDVDLEDVATEDIPIHEVDPIVNVAETEAVHEEREAISGPLVDDSSIVEEIQRVRILGRRRPLNHSTWTAVDIMINEPAFRDAQAHAISNPDREVAGVLVGPPPEKQPDGRYVVHVSNTIIAKHTRMQGASVTYTPESWRYIHDKLAIMYPNDEAVIVGWYHTHPGFGIFLSGMDQFIHQNFFTQMWHVALVLDPRAHKSGFFCWDRQQTRVDPYEFPWPIWALGSW